MEPTNPNLNTQIPTGDKSLDEKRRLARLSMENDTERQRREAEEKVQAEKKRVEELAKKAEADKKAAAEKVRMENEMKQRQEAEAKMKDSSRLKKELENIKAPGREISALRSFRGDMDEMIKNQNISVARIVMQEDTRKREEVKEATAIDIKKWGTVAAIIVLLLGGTGIGYYFYNLRTAETEISPNAPAVSEKLSQPLIFSDITREIPLADISKEKITSATRDEINGTSVEPGKVVNFRITKDEAGTKTDATTADVLSRLDFRVPDNLARSFGPRFMFGFINTVENAKSGIIILRPAFYEIAFSGMLKWESGSLIKDTYEILTGSAPSDDILQKKFEDSVINNQDSRIIKNESGDIVMIYGFPDSDTIIMAGNVSAFNEAITRFRTNPPIE